MVERVVDQAGLEAPTEVELQPLNWRPWWELGRFEEGQQDFGRAIPALERAVELDPLNPLTTGELANARSNEP